MVSTGSTGAAPPPSAMGAKLAMDRYESQCLSARRLCLAAAAAALAVNDCLNHSKLLCYFQSNENENENTIQQYS